MSTIELTLASAYQLAFEALTRSGFSDAQAETLARSTCRAQADDCHSHGLYRLLGCVQSLKRGKADGQAVPSVSHPSEAIVRVDCRAGYSLLGFDMGRHHLVEKARRLGLAAMALNNCYHLTALWPEVEDIAADGLAAIAMLPSHSYVAPAGGTKPLFGTNPLAFAWPRPGGTPYVFDFATSVAARGEIELHLRAGKPLPDGWAIDSDGVPTNDPGAALAGAMLPFGGHKGSALSTMIELLAGPLIGDLLSFESLAQAGDSPTAPNHGELVIAFDPRRFSLGPPEDSLARAETLFAAIQAQGARLPSQRRYAARAVNNERGAVTIPHRLYVDIDNLRRQEPSRPPLPTAVHDGRRS